MSPIDYRSSVRRAAPSRIRPKISPLLVFAPGLFTDKCDEKDGCFLASVLNVDTIKWKSKLWVSCASQKLSSQERLCDVHALSVRLFAAPLRYSVTSRARTF